MQVRNVKELKLVRSHLRANMPAPEILLWQKIRSKALGVKFRRQFSIQNFVLDFYSPEWKLAIEIDGESHFVDAAAAAKDKIRDIELGKLGIKVLRFTNRDVMDNLEGVIAEIIKSATPSQSPPTPIAIGTGGEGREEK